MQLLEKAPALSFGALPDSTRFRLAELLSMLEAHNPTSSPTTSTLMDVSSLHSHVPTLIASAPPLEAP